MLQTPRNPFRDERTPAVDGSFGFLPLSLTKEAQLSEVLYIGILCKIIWKIVLLLKEKA